MNKYTRREFFKGIIPVSVGIVSFLGGGSSEEASLVSDYELIEYMGRNPTKDEIERGKELRGFFYDLLINDGIIVMD